MKGEVALTAERERHIAERHPDPLPDHRERVAETVTDPDQVRRSARFGNARLLSRWYTDLKRGKHVVVESSASRMRGVATGSSRPILRESWPKENWNGRETDFQV